MMRCVTLLAPEPLRVAVVGGGITGLAAAFELERRAEQAGQAVRVTLLEAGDRLGGRLRTELVGDVLVEHGPDALFVRTPEAGRFCEAIGLGDEVLRPDPRYRQAFIVLGGRLAQLPPGMEGGVPRDLRRLALTPMLTPLGKARAALELLLPPRRETSDESIYAFMRRRFGREVAERIAKPLLGAIYSADVYHLSLHAITPHLREMERQHGGVLRATLKAPRPSGTARPAYPHFITLKRGAESMVPAIVQHLRHTDLRLRAPVRALRERGGGWDLQVGDGSVVQADHVVLTLPSPVAADLLQPIEPSVTASLRATRYSTVAIVALVLPPEAEPTVPGGSGMLVAPDEDTVLAACSFTSRKWPHCTPGGEVLLRCHVHQDRWPEVYALDDEALARRVRADLARLTGIHHAPLATRVFRWPNAVPHYAVGHLDRLAQVRSALARHPGLLLAGAGYGGVGLPECIRQGRQAAEQVLATAAKASRVVAG